MKLVKIFVCLVVLAVVLLGARMYSFGQSQENASPGTIGIENGHLKACGTKPNCVSSQAETSSKFYIEALKSNDLQQLWQNLQTKLPEMGLDLKTSESNYLHFTETSKLFKFVDDIEFLLNTQDQLIEVRSQSRVGYSDMGVNRKRVERIRKALGL